MHETQTSKVDTEVWTGGRGDICRAYTDLGAFRLPATFGWHAARSQPVKTDFLKMIYYRQ